MTSEYERALEEQASALTTCSICTDVFKKPKVLPCQHTFCLGCLQRHHDATNSQRLVPVSSFACPTCRKVCYVPRQSLQQLPTDFKVDQILDLVKIISKSRGSVKDDVSQGQGLLSHCVVCRSARGLTNEADVFCVQCARSFCKNCSEHHSRTPVFQEHTVVPVTEATSATWRCATHDLEVQYFCDECVAPSCTICVLSIHEKHSISDHRTVASRLHGQLTKFYEELKRKKADLNLQLEAIDNLKQEHLRTLQESERAVLGASREAYSRIRDLEEQTLMDLRSCSREKMEKMDSVEKGISEKMKFLASLCHSFTEVLALTNLKVFFDSYSQLAVIAQEEMSEAGPDVGTSLRNVSTFIPRVQVRLGEMQKKLLSIEELIKVPLSLVSDFRESGTEATTKADSQETLAIRKTSPASVTLESPKIKTFEVGLRSKQASEQSRGHREEFLNALERRLTARQPNDNTADNSTKSCSNHSSSINATNAHSSNSFITSDNIRPSNEAVIQRTNTAKSRINSTSSTSTVGTSGTSDSCSSPVSDGLLLTSVRNANSSSSCSGSEMLWINENFSNCRDCCFISENQLIATDYAMVSNRVKLFASVSGQLLDTVDSCLILQPWALCYNDYSASVLLTDHGGNPTLKTIRVAPTRDVRVYRCHADQPSGIAVTRSGDIVMTDTGARRFKIGVYSSLQGRTSKIREFGCHGDGEGEVLRANYVTVDHNDRVIVSDCESHTVKVFSLGGQQLLKFSSSGSDGREMSPQGLAVDDANNILVADQAIQGVVKYSSSGQLMEVVTLTLGIPWGISVNWEESLLAVATTRGLEVYRV